jgi:hypothetical protein
MLGNRGGCMHSDDRRIVRPWVNKRWICCLLEYKGWHREVMQPNRYTELFFLDEATAFASGHRPCKLCRREDHLRFKEAWCAANASFGIAPDDSIDAIDAVLHRERLTAFGERPTVEDPRALADGTFVARGGSAGAGEAFLIARGRMWRWSFGGYRGERRPGGQWRLLTPPSVVAAFASGYGPGIHQSAG